jgi:hypothetical protein
LVGRLNNGNNNFNGRFYLVIWFYVFSNVSFHRGGQIMDIKTQMNLIKSVVEGDGDFKKSYKKFKELEKKSKKVKK